MKNKNKLLDCPINVLSLFDGISCGHVALDRAGIQIKNYYASEINSDSIKVTNYNFPQTILHKADWRLQKNPARFFFVH